MTSNFDKQGPSRKRQAVSQSSAGQSAPAAALDNLKRDRFELLSAYLDGEVTVSERRQVEQWLETDQNMRCLYSRLLKLRQGMRTMAVPASERSVEQTIESAIASPSKLTRYDRYEILNKARDLVGKHADELANLIRMEAGLCMRETRYEVGRARDVLQFAAMKTKVIHRTSHGDVGLCGISHQAPVTAMSMPSYGCAKN